MPLVSVGRSEPAPARWPSDRRLVEAGDRRGIEPPTSSVQAHQVQAVVGAIRGRLVRRQPQACRTASTSSVILISLPTTQPPASSAWL